MAKIIQLAEERVESFDHDATAVHTIGPVLEGMHKLMPGRKQIALLDVGGGNGTFLDAMLRATPGSTGTLVEMSKGMAERNTINERKTVVCANFLQWTPLVPNSVRFDVVFFNFVLHHFVGGNRGESVMLQEKALQAARSVLADGGLVVVYEIHYNGSFQDEIPSWLIHVLSASKFLAPLTKRMGANTAGYGVCFHSEPYWRSLFRRCGLDVAHEYLIENGVFRGGRQRILQVGLNIGSMNYKIHFLQSSELP